MRAIAASSHTSTPRRTSNALNEAASARLCPPVRPPAAAKLATLEVVCSTALSFGEQSEAASPLDPAFHAIHPTLERIWQYRVLAGGVSDYSWPTASADLCIFGASAARAVFSYRPPVQCFYLPPAECHQRHRGATPARGGRWC